MWWHDRGEGVARCARLVLALTLPILLAGCFQPLYGDRSVTTPGGPSIRQQLSAIAVNQISAPPASPEARIAVTLRNALLFELTGGSEPAGTTHRLQIQLRASRQQVIVDITTARPDVELVGFHASYSLTEVATGKVVITGQTSARASYDIPGQQQRFAGARGQLDAQERTAKVLAEAIRSRLASYFVAGT